MTKITYLKLINLVTPKARAKHEPFVQQTGLWAFYDQAVKVEKGWVEQEFVLLIIVALPSKAGLPNE